MNYLNAEKIAKAIREYLVEKSENNGLMLDLYQLGIHELANIILEAQPDPDNMIELAGNFLSGFHSEIFPMIEAIVAHEDQNELIDYVNGVVVWENVEFSMSCTAFLLAIGYQKES